MIKEFYKNWPSEFAAGKFWSSFCTVIKNQIAKETRTLDNTRTCLSGCCVLLITCPLIFDSQFLQPVERARQLFISLIKDFLRKKKNIIMTFSCITKTSFIRNQTYKHYKGNNEKRNCTINEEKVNTKSLKKKSLSMMLFNSIEKLLYVMWFVLPFFGFFNKVLNICNRNAIT